MLLHHHELNSRSPSAAKNWLKVGSSNTDRDKEATWKIFTLIDSESKL